MKYWFEDLCFTETIPAILDMPADEHLKSQL